MVFTLTKPMTVDQVCRDRYGDESGYVEAVLAANSGAADRPVIKPVGFTLMLPEIAMAEPSVPVVSLWD